MEYTKQGFETAQKNFNPADLEVDLSQRSIMITGANSGTCLTWFKVLPLSIRINFLFFSYFTGIGKVTALEGNESLIWYRILLYILLKPMYTHWFKWPNVVLSCTWCVAAKSVAKQPNRKLSSSRKTPTSTCILWTCHSRDKFTSLPKSSLLTSSGSTFWLIMRAAWSMRERPSKAWKLISPRTLWALTYSPRHFCHSFPSRLSQEL